MAVCPFADQSRRYDGAHPGGYVSGFGYRGVLHSTETTGLPSYQSGAVAPHFTVDPKTGRVYQHFDTSRPSRALKHPAGTIDTNNARAIQIEIIAYSDANIAAQVGGLRVDQLSAAQLAPIAKLMRWIETTHAVASRSGLAFKSYPGSAGVSNGVRMSSAAWQAFGGWCGHSHVPVNDHGDPSDIAIAALLAQVAPTPIEEDPLAAFTDEQVQKDAGMGVHNQQLGRSEIAPGQPLTIGIALSRMYAASSAQTAQIAALTAAVQALAAAHGLDEAAIIAAVDRDVKAALDGVSITLTTTPKG